MNCLEKKQLKKLLEIENSVTAVEMSRNFAVDLNGMRVLPVILY